ncbi:MAG: hypothetical protein ABR75_00750 [Acidimicrobiia bacterium BACL6 MAG-120924-bin43]|uniref:Uncharacterized protein n=1 Tax=Acidimicrobiia bacterium BACL6 MAG-120924-bin43 TaxID=1655583 RepID=A0A0R2QCU4_9ACTN|nr:MAG: hypothetical protein ABR75_00750 [Acidimicrobiia bacterium BACL6 MAG-120924-bin43]KRO56909.1 MAG: hypothetical protein ABR77_05945 [Acidimicrobiia bacterium BACL6 MAG-120322-bin79]
MTDRLLMQCNSLPQSTLNLLLAPWASPMTHATIAWSCRLKNLCPPTTTMSRSMTQTQAVCVCK